MEKVMRKLIAVNVLVILVVGLMLTGKSSAINLVGCATCVLPCFTNISDLQSLGKCVIDCVPTCIQPTQNDVGELQDLDGLDYCKLGCAISMCSNFSKRNDTNGEKVDGCVGSCSNKCVKSYSLPQNSTN
ncbi:Thionin-like protein 2 [Striga hermonthica]|uniref:Thionin-like protein 2 n=1 Tax=Striga hermonthica TaxID=68872 RepID=A0A9N7NN45_STRHE|nr:Thionin-like protein 2 [Striga hermonthica]